MEPNAMQTWALSLQWSRIENNGQISNMIHDDYANYAIGYE